MQSTYGWFDNLDDERQEKEIIFARLYANDFHHGTDGHNRLMLINKLADLLDKQEDRIVQLQNKLREAGL